MLFMSVDSAADLVIQGHPHGDNGTHINSEADGATQPPTSDNEPQADHCERCCHGHSASAIVQISAMTALPMNSDRCLSLASQHFNFSQAPPTPPPNA